MFDAILIIFILIKKCLKYEIIDQFIESLPTGGTSLSLFAAS